MEVLITMISSMKNRVFNHTKENEKRGKKKMREIGNVEVPQGNRYFVSNACSQN